MTRNRISSALSARPQLLLADEPYAHETSEGAASVTYFRTCDPVDLAVKMKKILNDN